MFVLLLGFLFSFICILPSEDWVCIPFGVLSSNNKHIGVKIMIPQEFTALSTLAQARCEKGIEFILKNDKPNQWTKCISINYGLISELSQQSFMQAIVEKYCSQLKGNILQYSHEQYESYMISKMVIEYASNITQRKEYMLFKEYIGKDVVVHLSYISKLEELEERLPLDIIHNFEDQYISVTEHENHN